MLRSIGRYWQKRREQFYFKSRWHLILDYSLIIIILLLLGIVIGLYFYHPSINQSVVVPAKKNELNLNNPPLNYSFSVSDSIIKSKDALSLKIILKNVSQFEIEDIKTKFLIVNKNFLIEKIENVNELNKIEFSNNQIIFEKLGANESREVDLLIYFKAKNDSDRHIKWQAQNEYSVGGQLVTELVELTDISLAAEIEASARAYYNSPQGDQLGSGPLPPIASLPTSYWIFFDVLSYGDFKNLVFSAKLPKEVELTDSRSLLAGDFKYNPASRKVIWTVPELKNQSDSYRVGFEVKLLPSKDQVGRTPILMTDINYYARDVLTNRDSSNELPDINTNLDFDRINKGHGEVVLP